MTAAILGQYVVNKTYERVKIKIAFHPIDERFEVQNPAILKDKTWLHDIGDAINGDLFEIADKYFELNHQFVSLTFADTAKLPQYTAKVFIGYDCITERYVAHWLDNFQRQWVTE